jgi:predicted phosphodiesterase
MDAGLIGDTLRRQVSLTNRMYRIAVFSDVHANLPALEAVLETIESLAPDLIVCLGDLVDFAPWPNEVIETIKARNICTLMGNHDERIAYNLDLTPLAKHGPDEQAARAEAIEWSRVAVTAPNKAFLAGLPKGLQLAFGPIEKGLRIQFVHASTRSINEYIYEDHPEEDVESMFASTGTNVIVMGHTHLPYVRSFGNGEKLLVNVGSVGRSKETSRKPSFAVLSVNSDGVKAEIIRLSYPSQRAIEAIRQSAIPDFYANFLAATP